MEQKFNAEIWTWECPKCQKTGKKIGNTNLSYKLFLNHMYQQRSKLNWDCEYELKQVKEWSW